ncbi:hypothetical protein [Aestuariirhabdus litorea]|uniref:DUF423 domain-containing protein n=1 Tax=Aestuariirhabdus litorea TaxID=2528527 RepID=A0A3P3VMF3_9GAMM|nr:hypothetical protein [Aestuariirhabdus litorea]RRJ82846.1 hypothetical protein D0544_13430 [Aestuariirhabdus litorea]RWW93005.1 hypothetical protein DZC74_13405 [Endozoicomonadaceae bacterium GTF-13]
MKTNIDAVRPGVLICLLIMLFGIGLGIGFGVNEDAFKDYIAQGIAAAPQLHDGNSAGKIWRYAQRAHFHALGIAAFSLGLILVVALSSLAASLKKVTAVLISLGGLYALAWFTMFLLSPSMGRDGAHEALMTSVWIYLGVGSLTVGMLILIANLAFGFGRASNARAATAYAR